ncbi:hypothetical protein SLA2020_099170 [Shorea laevis]
MRSSQRSERINAFFDGYVNSMTPLHEFVSQYSKALQCRREEEENEDLVTMRMKPNFQGMHPLEVHAGKVYTRKLFTKFQLEFKEAFLHCWHDGGVSNNDGVTTYVVHYEVDGKFDSHVVHCGPLEGQFNYYCGMFETAGLLCKHILYVMKQYYRLKLILEQYILSRWTLAHRHRSKNGGPRLISTSKETEVTPLEAWDLRKALDEMYEKAIKHRDLYNAIATVLDDLMKQFGSIWMEQEELSIDQSEQVISQVALSTNITIRDPTKAKTKGRPKEATRIPSEKQVSQAEAQKRSRTCGVCHDKGHDIRTCPIAKERAKEQV